MILIGLRLNTKNKWGKILYKYCIFQVKALNSHFLFGVRTVLPIGIGLPRAPAGQVGRDEGAVLGHAGVGPGQFGAPLPRPDGGNRCQGRVLLGGGQSRVLHGSHDDSLD